MTRSAAQATSTYYQAGPGLQAFRMALAASQRLAPALAVRVATRLFGTPLPLRWLQRGGAWGADWRIERWPFEQASLTLYAPATAAPGPVVLLVHGWGGQARQLLPLAEVLAQQGLRPLLLEMPAHGRSAGAVSNLPQFARALDYVLARLQHEGQAVRGVVAHSLGANAAAYVASRSSIAARLVLLAPPASPRAYTRYFAQVFGLSESIRARMQARIEAREGVLMAQFEPKTVGTRIDARTLVVHDREDRINPYADGLAFSQAIEGAQLVTTQGLGHRKLLRDPLVLGQVAAFLRGN